MGNRKKGDNFGEFLDACENCGYVLEPLVKSARCGELCA